MFSFQEQIYLRRRRGMAGVAFRRQTTTAIKELMFAGIQTAGGTALAFYTYKNSSSGIAPAICSAIAIGGTVNVFRSIKKIFCRSSSNKEEGSWCSLNNVATGTIIYIGSLYTFSETWRSDNNLWMNCLGSAALGFYYAVSSYRKGVTTIEPLSKCCQLAFEPALIVAGAAYLKCFRNHEEDWVYWIPMVATGLIGFIFTFRGFFTPMNADDPNIMLLQAIEVLKGGCLVTDSSLILGIYASMKEIHPSLVAYAVATGSIGACVIVAAMISVQCLFGVDKDVAVDIALMMVTTITIFGACMFVRWTKHEKMAYIIFCTLAGGACVLLMVSLHHLHETLPRSVFIRYCQRAWGPMLTSGGLVASACIGYRSGWNSRYCLLTTSFVPAGIYVTYKGYSEIDES